MEREALPVVADSDGRYLLSVKQVAEKLGLARTTVYDLVSKRRLRPVHYGPRVLVPVAEVERFVREWIAEEGLYAEVDD